MSKSLGISPLLATVLLVATTVVISTMLAGWVSSTTSATQNIISNKTTEGVACAAAEIIIDDVYTGAGSGSIARAIVRNSGGSDNLAITSAQLYDKFGNNFTTTNTMPTNLNKGQIATLSFNYSVLPTTTNDSAHGVNNGTLTNGPLFTLSGKYLGALKFDGIDDQVINGNDSTLNFGTNNFSIAFWANPNSISGNIDIIGKWQGGVGGYSASKVSSGLPIISIGGNNGRYRYCANAMTVGSWMHIVFVKSGSNYNCYQDGVQSDGASASLILDTGSTTNNLVFGYGSNYGGYYNGTIDDVAIWNRSLSGNEISTSMNYGPLTVSNTNDLILYFKFDEGKGVLSCPSDFSRVVVTTNCGGVSAEFTKPPKC